MSATAKTPTTAGTHRGPAPGRFAFLTASGGGQNLSLIGALVVVLVLFGVLNDNYLSVSNVQVIAEPGSTG
ncbi:hypothetical protein OG393_01815 [Streptomyces sp. NBC_01216]|uniref:hypothetical protein n=1 Tax=Streptomyces sp. NBC_01216 TaxID=2903778 RepID=UPI002E0F638D|nr:hypothetical protein OG393_01815 [Streptomyces sp. NBC_01216]